MNFVKPLDINIINLWRILEAAKIGVVLDALSIEILIQCLPEDVTENKKVGNHPVKWVMLQQLMHEPKTKRMIFEFLQIVRLDQLPEDTVLKQKLVDTF